MNTIELNDGPLDRLEELFTQRRREKVIANNRRIRLSAFDEKYADENWQMSDGRIRLASELTSAEMRVAEIEGEIVEAARQIAAEADNAELIGAQAYWEAARERVAQA